MNVNHLNPSVSVPAAVQNQAQVQTQVKAQAQRREIAKQIKMNIHSNKARLNIHTGANLNANSSIAATGTPATTTTHKATATHILLSTTPSPASSSIKKSTPSTIKVHYNILPRKSPLSNIGSVDVNPSPKKKSNLPHHQLMINATTTNTAVTYAAATNAVAVVDAKPEGHYAINSLKPLRSKNELKKKWVELYCKGSKQVVCCFRGHKDAAIAMNLDRKIVRKMCEKVGNNVSTRRTKRQSRLSKSNTVFILFLIIYFVQLIIHTKCNANTNANTINVPKNRFQSLKHLHSCMHRTNQGHQHTIMEYMRKIINTSMKLIRNVLNDSVQRTNVNLKKYYSLVTTMMIRPQPRMR